MESAKHTSRHPEQTRDGAVGEVGTMLGRVVSWTLAAAAI